MDNMNSLRIPLLAGLVLTGVTLSAQAAMQPNNVGDVSLYGNITANSPMWQWTVNDYPGARLDAKPSAADTSVVGTVSYPLNGQWFMAASGYLPSLVGGKIGTVSNAIGVTDITTLTSPDGPVTLNTTANPATVSLPATGSDTAGRPISGTLILAADEIRGYLNKYTAASGTSTAYAYLFSATTATPATSAGSCWVGRPGVPAANYTRTGTATTLPVFTDAGSTAASGAVAHFNAMLAAADSAGTVRWASVLPSATMNATVVTANSCAVSSSASTVSTSETSTTRYPYRSAAHVLALRPQTVSFPVAATGAWNATLTVTAYQM
jgi:hypothetical protein